MTYFVLAPFVSDFVLVSGFLHGTGLFVVYVSIISTGVENSRSCSGSGSDADVSAAALSTTSSLLSKTMTSYFYSAPIASDEQVTVDIGFSCNSPLRGVSEIAACCETGKLAPQCSSVQVALLETPSLVGLDQACLAIGEAKTRLLTLRFAIYKIAVRLDRVPLCAQRSVARPQRLTKVDQAF